MYSRIITQDSFNQVITLLEAKRQCRVTHTFDDDYIESLIPVACEMAQSYSGRLLTVGSVSSVIETYQSVVMLPFGEVTAVTELKLDGVVSTDFTFDDVTQKVTINTEFTQAKITYSCGYATAPTAVKQAVLMIISTLYDSRQDFVAGLTVANMPMTSKTLLDSVRYYGV